MNTPTAPGPQALVPHALQANAPAARPATAAPAGTAAPIAPAEVSLEPVAVAETAATQIVHHAPLPVSRGAAAPAAAPVSTGGTLAGPAYVGEVAAEAGPPPVPMTTAARTAGVGARAFAAEEPDEPAPRKASLAFEAQTEAAPSSGQVSVTLSESDGVLNIVASAPGLTEGDRQSLERMTDDIAGETGAPLGELRLNGVTIRPFSKVS